MPWIADGIDGGEFNAVRGLFLLVNEGYSADFIELPWVVEGRNYQALDTLWKLAINNPDRFTKIMSHPTIRDGITDQDAKIIATLRQVEDDLLDKLLDPTVVNFEGRNIILPLTGEMELSILRIGPGADHTMDLVEQAVRSIEEFMAYPFPQQQGIYLFEESGNGPAGVHHSTHVALYVDELTSSKEAMLDLVAHETGHYFWRSPTDWMNEGSAVFLEAVVKGTLLGPLETRDCILAENIADFEELDPDPTSYEYNSCPYSLGERLFRDLYLSMDETAFRQAFRRLHLHTLFNFSDECDDYAPTICHVREAFLTYAPEETRAVVERVINLRYGRAVLQDASIRGIVRGSEARLPGEIALTPELEGRGPLVEISPDGTFDVEVESGSYILTVRVKVGSEWVFIGWYDGIGGITIDRSKASQVMVKGIDIEGIEITLSSDAEDLLCPSGYFRSFFDGQCYES